MDELGTVNAVFWVAPNLSATLCGRPSAERPVAPAPWTPRTASLPGAEGRRLSPRRRRLRADPPMRMTTAPPGVTDRARMTTRPTPSHENDWPTSALVEEMMDCYIGWRDSAAAAADAYRRWADAPSGRCADRFLAYIAALDQEESAAIGFALAVAEVERRMQREHGRETEH
jgi:hypothetical protein